MTFSNGDFHSWNFYHPPYVFRESCSEAYSHLLKLGCLQRRNRLHQGEALELVCLPSTEVSTYYSSWSDGKIQSVSPLLRIEEFQTLLRLTNLCLMSGYRERASGSHISYYHLQVAYRLTLLKSSAAHSTPTWGSFSYSASAWFSRCYPLICQFSRTLDWLSLLAWWSLHRDSASTSTNSAS